MADQPSTSSFTSEESKRLGGVAWYPNQAIVPFLRSGLTIESVYGLDVRMRVAILIEAGQAYARQMLGTLLARDQIDPQAISLYAQSSGVLVGTFPKQMALKLPEFLRNHIEFLEHLQRVLEKNVTSYVDPEKALREAGSAYQHILRHRTTVIYNDIPLDTAIDLIKAERRILEALALPISIMEVKFGQ